MPYSGCQILITRGKNNGQVCGQVCKQCRHVSLRCLKCNKYFTRDTTYLNHTKTCKAVPLPIAASTSRIKPVVLIKKDGVETVKETVIKEIYNNIHKMVKSAIDENLNNMQAPISITNNIINNSITYQHVSISEIGAFKTLCDKMGINEATEFLCKLAAKPQIMTLFEKLYLECDPANYPIANNNGKDFFYRDADDKIIHDEGGHKIAKLGERLMKNTFLEAADPLLTRFIRQNEGDHEGDDDDYDRFRELQNGAHASKADRSFVKELYPKTYNPKHVFFTPHEKKIDSF